MSIREISQVRIIKEGFVQSYFIKENFEILTSIINKNTNLDLHHHPHMQFGYCFYGEFMFNVDGDKNKILPGDSYLLAGEIPHSANAIEDFYALDFKYSIENDKCSGFTFDILTELHSKDKYNVSVTDVGNAKIFKISGKGKLDLKELTVDNGNPLYIAAADKVKINLDNDESIYIFPMKTYEINDVRYIKIDSYEKEMLLIQI